LRADPFDYLVMSDSLLDAQSLSSVYESLNSLLPANATYLGDDLPLIMDPRSGVDDRTGMPVFRSLERSVDPVALGRTLVDAVRTHPGIIVREGSAVAALGGDDDGVRVTLEDDIVRHRFAINCAWDQRERLLPEGVARRPHNYRVKMSLRLAPVDGARTATLVQGPYGDVVAFPDYTYASWYPVGRLTNEYLDAPSPGAVAALAAARTDDDLGVRQIAALQSLSLLPDDIRVTEIMGGFILGHGAPDIDLVESGLHRRSEFGVRRHGSVVTPVSYKFGSGPLAASAAVAELSAAFG
jgi:hypothetical protein